MVAAALPTHVFLQKQLLDDVVWVELISRGDDLLLVAMTEDKLNVREGRVCLFK